MKGRRCILTTHRTLRPLPSQLGRTVGRPWVAKSQRPQVPRQRQAGRAAPAAMEDEATLHTIYSHMGILWVYIYNYI